MLATLHYEDFAPHVNTRFQMELNGGGMMEIELIRVEEKSPSPRQEQFVLTFLAPHEAPAMQWLYQLRHERLGSGQLFLVPVGKGEEGLTYEAVFNRKRKVEP